MKAQFLIIYLLITSYSSSQNTADVKFEVLRDYSKNGEYVHNCIENIELDRNTLKLDFYKNVQSDSWPKPELTFELRNDSLFLAYFSNWEITSQSIKYNSDKHKYDTLITARQYGSLLKVPGCHLHKMIIKGINVMPKYIEYNGAQLKPCPEHFIDYSIYEGDTVNIINSNGYKQGCWIDFYENGIIKNKVYFDNGEFVTARSYDENGNLLPGYSISNGNQIHFKLAIDTIKKHSPLKE